MVKSLAALTIRPTAYKVAHRFGVSINYSAYVEEVRLTAGNGLAANDNRDLPLHLDGSKTEFKTMVKRLLPNATVVWPEVRR